MLEKTENIAGENLDSPDEIRRPFEKTRTDGSTVGGLTSYHETLVFCWQEFRRIMPTARGETCQRFYV